MGIDIQSLDQIDTIKELYMYFVSSLKLNVNLYGAVVKRCIPRMDAVADDVLITPHFSQAASAN